MVDNEQRLKRIETELARVRRQMDSMSSAGGFHSARPMSASDIVLDGQPWVDVRSHSGISQAIVDIGSRAGTLLVPSSLTLTANLTIPTTTTLKVVKGAVITIPTGMTLTVNGPFEAGLYQVFNCVGTGAVVFGNGSVKECYPQWWGAVGDGVTNDTAAIQASLTAITVGNGRLLFPVGDYATTAKLTATLAANSTTVIEGTDKVRILPTVAEPGAISGLIEITGVATSHLFIRNIKVVYTATAVGLWNGFYLKGPFAEVNLDNVSATKASLWGMSIDQALSGTIKDCHCNDNRNGGCGLTGCSNMVALGGEYSDNGTPGGAADYGFSLTSGANLNSNILITGLTADRNYRKGIDVHNGHGIRIIGNSVTTFGMSTNAAPIGIYAVNETTLKRVKDVIISGNLIDGTGAGASVALYGIEIGAHGPSSLESGTFVVSHNIIRNIDKHTSSMAILIRNPDSGGIPPDKVIITDNTIQNGSGATGQIIKFHNAGVDIPYANVSGNIVHSASCVVGINLLEVTNGIAANNTVIVDSGTVAYGIYLGSPTIIASGNQFRGVATYTVPIRTYCSFPLPGGQLAFPVSPNASADANTLDAYEEGTWTATLTCGTSGSITMNSNLGTYTKIGRLVTVHGYFSVTSVSSPVGELILNGLPFVIKASNWHYTAAAIYCALMEATAATQMMARGIPNTSTMHIRHFAAGVIAVAAADVKALTQIVVTMSYIVA